MTKRMGWLDTAKGIAILLMVAGHIPQIDLHPWRLMIFTFHMPLFFMAAGYTAKAELRWSSIKKSAARLLIPYLGAALIGAVWNLLHNSSLTAELLRVFWGSGTVGHYGPGRPLGGGDIPVLGAIWFLPCMFFGRLLFSGLLLAEKKWFPEKKAILPLAVLAFSACGYLIGQRYKLPLNVDIALYTMIFFYAGYCFRRTDGIEKSSVSLGLILVAVWFLAFRLDGVELAARIYGSFPRCILTAAGAVAGSLLVFYASRELVERCKPLERFLGYCGRNSMVILLLHYLDGRVYDLNWFAPQLEQAGLPRLVQGCILAVWDIAIYLLVCLAYTSAKQWLRKKRA